uniref:Uncharacterized protein n=1 Tax=Schistosoma japonicum TaxID=6182 RepID=Q5C0Y7_SCHJA|nr:unknown [Schistosoma japonicum]
MSDFMSFILLTSDMMKVISCKL